MERIFKRVCYDRYLKKGVDNETYGKITRYRDILIGFFPTQEEFMETEYTTLVDKFGINPYLDQMVYLAKAYLTDKKTYFKLI